MVDHNTLTSKIDPATIVLNHTRSENIAAQSILDTEQTRINSLTSSHATATLANAAMKAGSILDANALSKYGISLGTPAVGHSFTYTYAATTSEIIIKAILNGHNTLISTIVPAKINIVLTPVTTS